MTIKCQKGMGLVLCVVNLEPACIRLQTRDGDPQIESNKLSGMSYEKTISKAQKYLLDLRGISSLIYVLSNNDANERSK